MTVSILVKVYNVYCSSSVWWLVSNIIAYPYLCSHSAFNQYDAVCRQPRRSGCEKCLGSVALSLSLKTYFNRPISVSFVVTLSEEPADVYTLAQTLFLGKHYHRYTISCHSLLLFFVQDAIVRCIKGFHEDRVVILICADCFVFFRKWFEEVVCGDWWIVYFWSEFRCHLYMVQYRYLSKSVQYSQAQPILLLIPY